MVSKIILKLVKNFKILKYSLTTLEQKKNEDMISKFVWSRSFARICKLKPIYFPKRREITDTFLGNIFLLTPFFVKRSYANVNNKLKKNDVIYVSLNEMGAFSKKILPKINRPFVLVTGDSDYSTSKFKEILKNKFLIHWFAQNNDIKNKKITPIPIGLDYHTLLTENAFQEKKKSVQKQEKILESIREIKLKQQFKIFANFHLNCTSKRRRELYGILKNNKLFYFQKIKLPRIKMWKLQKKFVFNFSPIGNGMDCVRTWESLILGQIPIIEKTHTALDDLYEQFPIVLIEDISELTEQNLRIWKKKYSKQFNKELEKKLTNDYWIGEIRKVSQSRTY